MAHFEAIFASISELKAFRAAKKEWWTNVYPQDRKRVSYGMPHTSRSSAIGSAHTTGSYLIRVRFK